MSKSVSSSRKPDFKNSDDSSPLRSTVNSPKTVSKTSKCTSKRRWRHQNFKGNSKYLMNISSLFNTFQPFFIIFNLFDLKDPCLTLSTRGWPQITVFSLTNRFLSVFPFLPISERDKIVTEWVLLTLGKNWYQNIVGFMTKNQLPV